MVEAINNFLDNLFGTHTFTLFSNGVEIFTFDFGIVSITLFILFCLIMISSIFMWFFHIILPPNIALSEHLFLLCVHKCLQMLSNSCQKNPYANHLQSCRLFI